MSAWNLLSSDLHLAGLLLSVKTQFQYHLFRGAFSARKSKVILLLIPVTLYVMLLYCFLKKKKKQILVPILKSQSTPLPPLLSFVCYYLYSSVKRETLLLPQYLQWSLAYNRYLIIVFNCWISKNPLWIVYKLILSPHYGKAFCQLFICETPTNS